MVAKWVPCLLSVEQKKSMNFNIQAMKNHFKINQISLTGILLMNRGFIITTQN